jgi:hypothetical protein
MTTSGSSKWAIFPPFKVISFRRHSPMAEKLSWSVIRFVSHPRWLRENYEYHAQGSVTTVDINLTIIVGLAYDSQSRLYMLENTTGNLFPTPARERCCASLRSILLPRSLRAVFAHGNDIRSRWKSLCLEQRLRLSRRARRDCERCCEGTLASVRCRVP